MSREAVELRARIGNLPALAYALDGRGAAIAAPNTSAEHRAVGRELRHVAEQIGDRERVVSGHYHGFVEKINRGDVKHAQTDLHAATRIAEELRQPAQLWQVRSAWTMLALGAGRLSEAEQLIPDVLALGERAQPGNAAAGRHALLHAARIPGPPRGSRVDGRNVAAEYPARPVFRCVLAHLHVQRAHISEAQRVFDDLASGDDFAGLPFDMEWLYGMSLLAETCCSLDDRIGRCSLRATRSLRRVQRRRYAGGHPGFGLALSGLLAATLERWNAAGKHYDNASAMNASMGARPWQAHTQADHRGCC